MTGTDAPPALLSVVVPCRNEEAVLREFQARMQAALRDVADVEYELIYVDDGSVDDTFGVLQGMQREEDRVRVLRLSRNFGQELALTAGLAESIGDAAVLIDADLQDPPAVIAEMVSRWRAGADVVVGTRLARAGERRFKRWSASLFYRALNRLAEHAVPLDAGNFRLMDRKVVDALLAMPERDRLTRAMVSWIGFRQEAVSYERDPRVAGKTNYRLRHMLRLALDGVFSFSLRPLRLATWLGFMAASLALAGICYAVTVRLLTDAWVSGWAALFIATLFVGGSQLVVVGILGEYVGRIYGEVKRRPMYFVAQRLGFPADDDRASVVPPKRERGSSCARAP